MRWMGLVFVFFVVLGTRLFFAYSTPYLTSDQAYFEYRLVDNVLNSGLPLSDDSLSWCGSKIVLSPVFSYLLAFFGLFLPLGTVLKLVPNIFASFLAIPVFLIVNHYLRRYWVALLASFVASFVPIFISTTFNHVSAMSMVVPVFFMALYAFMRVPDTAWTWAFIVLMCFFAFLHPLSLVFVLGLAVFIVFCAVEGLRVFNSDIELLIFSLGFVLWAQFLLYKKAILYHGLSVFWLNIPSDLLSMSFSRLSILSVLLQVGFFPLFVGCFVLYRNVFRRRRKEVVLFFSMVLVVTVLLWFKLVEFFFGLTLLGVLLVILFADGFASFGDFVRKTKLSSLAPFFSVLLAVVVVVSSVVPAVVAMKSGLDDTVSSDDVSAFVWLRDNADSATVVLAPVSMGNYVSAIGNCANVIDTYFVLHEDADERYHDVERVYKSVLETEVVGIFDKYSASYVLVPRGKHFIDSDCFFSVFDSSIRVLQKDPSCHLRVV